MTIYYVSDNFVDSIDYTSGIGGAELSDAALRERLNLEIKPIRCRYLDPEYLSTNTYIISNHWTLSPVLKQKLIQDKNYILIEHDYQCLPNRNPWDNDPKQIVMDVDFVKAAKAVFFQTDCHMSMWQEMPEFRNCKNFYSLITTTYSKEELDIIRKISLNTYASKSFSRKFAVIDNPQPLKGRNRAVNYCLANSVDFGLVKLTINRVNFLTDLASYSTLVFLPGTPE